MLYWITSVQNQYEIILGNCYIHQRINLNGKPFNVVYVKVYTDNISCTSPHRGDDRIFKLQTPKPASPSNCVSRPSSWDLGTDQLSADEPYRFRDVPASTAPECAHGRPSSALHLPHDAHRPAACALNAKTLPAFPQ